MIDKLNKAIEPIEPLKFIAVIGAGYWGKNLIRVFAELGALHTVCDANVDLAKKYSEQYGVLYSTWQDILSNPDITAVAIAVPAASHFDFAKQALLADKHVFVEKPIALDINDAKELCALADQLNKILMVGHLLHYHPAFIKLKSLIKQGVLGRLQYVYSNRLNLGKIRNEEDILWSFAPHDISMILSLVKEPPMEVKATGAYYLNNSIADVTITYLSFASGVRSHIFVSWLHPIKEQKIIVIGDKSMAVFDDTLDWNQKLIIYPHILEWRDGLPQFNKADGQCIELEAGEPLKNELQHFIDSINNNTKPITDGYEALGVLNVLQLASTDLGISLQNNNIREKKDLNEINKAANHKNAFIHDTARVDDKVEIGAGSKIWHFSHILTDSKLGKNCIIGQNVMIGPAVTIGDNCKIQNNVSLYKGVKLGHGVFCGPSCVFTNVNTPRAEIERKDQFLETDVGDCATIGANATIICGVKLGKYSFVGAGAVVTKNVPDHALVVGNPAKQIGWVSHSGERLDKDLICPREGRKYFINNNKLSELEEINKYEHSIAVEAV